VLTHNPDPSKNIPGLLEFRSDTPSGIIHYLEEQGYRSAVLAGGAKTNAVFLEENLVDEIIVTIEGLLFGKGIGMCDGLKTQRELEIISVKQLSDRTVVVHYKVKR
jgi:riboflavin biosynthesis pyrimidine reductase